MKEVLLDNLWNFTLLLSILILFGQNQPNMSTPFQHDQNQEIDKTRPEVYSSDSVSVGTIESSGTLWESFGTIWELFGTIWESIGTIWETPGAIW